MPSAALVFRSTCGCFCAVYMNFMLKRAVKKKAMYLAMLKLRGRADGVMLGLLLTYLFWGSLLLRCGDVESNPGPKEMKQSRLSSARSSSARISVDKPPNSPAGASNDKVGEHTLSDLVGMLHALETKMDTRFDEMGEDMRSLREESVAMQSELRGMKGTIDSVRQQNEDLQRRNEDLTRRVEELERKADDLEGRSKRNNLIFYGLPRREGETSAECEGMLRDLLTDKLELSSDMDFDRVHRINSKTDSPVIARCVFYKQKMSVLKAKGKLRGTNVFIGEDFSSRVREIRKKLTPHLKKARSDGKRATMVFDHLIVDQKKFSVDSEDRLVEIK